MANKLVKSSLKHYGVKGMEWGKVKNEDKKPIGSASSFLVPILDKIPAMAKKLKTQTVKEVIENKKNKIDDWDKVPRFNPVNESISDAIKKVNEGYALSPFITTPMAYAYGVNSFADWEDKDFTNNCPSTTMAYELRRRGYDVEAGLTGGASPEDIANMYDLTPKELSEILEKDGIPPQSFEELVKTMEAMGPGARGFCLMFWERGGGHICSFEVDSKGKVIFIDAQSGAASNDKLSFTNPADYYKKAELYGIVRTDNRKPNLEVLKKWVRVDDKKMPLGSKKLNYLEPKNLEKGKAYISHSSEMLLSDLEGGDLC